jgi:DNA processing protein
MKREEIAILTHIKGLGSANILKLINYCNAQHIDTLHALAEADLTKVLSQRLANAIYDYLDTDIKNLYENIDRTFTQYAKNGIKCIAITDEQYPNILKASTNPPVLLYYRGNISLLNTPCIATIGTRESTTLGTAITTKTVEFLVENNFTIVSGLAKGIDETSHKATLSLQGKTIAVLPLIDTIYPASNKALAQDILDQGGLLISEVKPNSRFHAGQLVKRDRIQSGLSEALFVFETTINGGSMHATLDALKLERPVFTPDIYSLPSAYRELKQVEGIKHLIDTNQSIAYTSDNYDAIKALIIPQSKQSSLF